METHVRTPQAIFNQPQRLAVPLFQRRYVWTEDEQWEPLWKDVVRVAQRLLDRPNERPLPHFLGAVVLQQVARPAGLIQERTIIDGQQRLTTLQLLLDAMHSQLVTVRAKAPALRLERLIKNDEPFCSKPEDQFKVWPTNRDRPAFNAVMGAPPPIDYDEVPEKDEKIVEAHRFFSEETRKWLGVDGDDAIQTRAIALESVARDHLQMVVIDLGADENAQEIFETLNARMTPLTAADLIKNFVFQRLLDDGAEIEQAYERQWKEFETGFWETEVNVGRVRYVRSAVFLNHWLVARTGKEIVAREVFPCFKTFSMSESETPMADLLVRIHRAAGVYRAFIEEGMAFTGPIDRLGLFAYRTGVMESEVIKPLVLCLLDPQESPLPPGELIRALDSIESWMVRRMLIRATTKNYNQAVVELVSGLHSSPREHAGEFVTTYLAEQTSESLYWPDDEELRTELAELMVYRRLSRGRVRMVLEAMEDDLRGWRGKSAGLGAERVTRGTFAIEHVMPRKWMTHWPTASGLREDAERDHLIHTIGNLTLLAGRLNSKVSNGPWLGEPGKRDGLQEHDVLFLNRALVKKSTWTELDIKQRTSETVDRIIQIWPVPAGHKSDFARDRPTRRRRKLKLIDLLNAGVLKPGTRLFARSKHHESAEVTLLADGSLDVNGQLFESPSTAAAAITEVSTNGWWFLLVQKSPRRSLRDVRRDYLNTLAGDVDDDDDEDGDGDDE